MRYVRVRERVRKPGESQLARVIADAKATNSEDTSHLMSDITCTLFLYKCTQTYKVIIHKIQIHLRMLVHAYFLQLTIV